LMGFWPMNAQACKQENKRKILLASSDYVAEIKWNGYRQLFCAGEAFSRSKSVVTQQQVSKTAWIPHIAATLKEIGGWWFDGELLRYPDGKAKDVTRIMQSKLETALEKQEQLGKLTYVIFDVLRSPDGQMLNKLPWIKRRRILEHVFEKELQGHPYIRLSKYVSDNKEAFLEDVLKMGLEGIMLKNIHGLWIPAPEGGDSRPANNWYKIKAEIDEEDCFIIGFKAPEMYYTDPITGKEDKERYTRFYANNWIGGVYIGQYRNGIVVNVGSFSGISDQLRKDMSEFPKKYLNRVVKIKAFDREATGRFISPVFRGFRDDKRPEECVWRD
jgi:ATP-dependent DNA ligase